MVTIGGFYLILKFMRREDGLQIKRFYFEFFGLIQPLTTYLG
jgi:hypothetical protein